VAERDAAQREAGAGLLVAGTFIPINVKNRRRLGSFIVGHIMI
jgi:hypothetical protein